MNRVLMSILLLGLSVGLLWGQPVAFLANDYIEVGATASNGMFCIGTPDNPIMYGDPHSGGNSSHTNFYIDGTIYSNDPFMEGATYLLVDEPSHTSDHSIITKWVHNGITITQLLQPILVDSTGNVIIQYSFINSDSVSHSVGLLSTIDLYIGGEDRAPISVPGFPFVDTTLIFLGSDVPDYWRAYSVGPEEPDSVQVVAQCNLLSPGFPKPDYIVFGDNRDILSTLWDFVPPTNNHYEDSGVLIRWDPFNLAPGNVLTLRYSFGLAPLTSPVEGPLSLRFESPRNLGFYNCALIPNPFLVTVRVTNTTFGTADSVKVKLTLPAGLELAEGTAEQFVRPNMTLAPGITGYGTWTVRANNPLTIDQDIPYRITAYSTTVDSNSGVDSIFVPYSTFTGPHAEIRTPRNNTYTSDTRQIVRFYLKDDYPGVDTTRLKISMLVGVSQTIYSYASGVLYFESDSILAFNAPDGYRDGSIVTITLIDAPDWHGCNVDNNVSVGFIVDASGPVLESFSPADSEMVFNATTPLVMNLYDNIGKLNFASLDFTINGISYPYDGEIVFYNDTTDEMIFNPVSAFGTGWNDGYYSVCLNDIQDSPDYGSPNHLVGAPRCWFFTVNAHGPIATLVSPRNNAITSCDNQAIRFHLSDGNGVNRTSLAFTLNGYTYGISSLVTINDTTFEFRPGGGWMNGERVNFSLTTCNDNLGTPILRALTTTFQVDLRPPQILDVMPAPNDTVGEPLPVIMATLVDSLAGVMVNSIKVIAGRDTFSYGHPSISWDPPFFLTFNLDAAGYPLPTRFDTVRVCISVTDTAEYCPVNSNSYCWSFFRLIQGPRGAFVNDSIVCDRFENIRFTLFDEQGVLESSIRLSLVSPYDSLNYTISSSELSYDGTYLILAPSTPLRQGVTYRACIRAATDGVGTPISAPICGTFLVDDSAPYVSYIYPPDSEINDTLQPIVLVLSDSGRTIQPASIVFTIMGVDYRIGSAGLTFANDTLTFNPVLAGIVYPVRENINVNLETIDYCGNQLNWSYSWYETYIKDNLSSVPKTFSIVANYPNPFNMGTNILVSIPEYAFVKIDIVNVMGELVNTLHYGNLNIGYHNFFWDGKTSDGNNTTSGLYFIRMVSKDKVEIKAMVLLK